METIIAKKLTLESYHPYGEFANLVQPEGQYIGDYPARFFRDMVSVYTGNAVTSFSIVHTDRQEMVPTEAEQHASATEVLLPLEDDIVIFVAPATDKRYPYGQTEAFIVPKGTLITIKPGVWHKAPYPVNRDKAATLVILPEREYALDCYVMAIDSERNFRIICEQ